MPYATGVSLLLVGTIVMITAIDPWLGLGAVIVLWLGGRMVVAGTISLGQFVAFGAYLVMLNWPMIALGWVVNLFEREGVTFSAGVPTVWLGIQQYLMEHPEADISSIRTFLCGGSAVPRALIEWFATERDTLVLQGWGMTETSGLSCTNMPFQANRLGTIGVPLEGTELKVSDEGELLIRSPGLFTEYFKQPDLTADAFAEGGFFRTGDKAEWDKRREDYRITGRVKDIFKSAKGKYVVPVPIESHLSANPLIEQVCVVGSGLPAPIALVVLSDAARQLPKETVEESLDKTRLETNRQLESHERLGGAFIMDEEWTTESGIQTPTLKVRRDRIEARYLSMVNRKFENPTLWERDL